jgi:argininosuccinate lyase
MDVCLYMSQNFDFITLLRIYNRFSIMPHKKTRCFEINSLENATKFKALPYEITLITNNFSGGYHEDLQLLKEGLFPAIQNLKACLDIRF